jgi:hypothetical protein
VSVAVKYR